MEGGVGTAAGPLIEGLVPCSGSPGLESLPAEADELERVRRLELLADLFATVSEKTVDAT
ncbi:hypothetical protein ABZS81_19210 [Streptomyces sp. NPDC005318]|uniref:hypothetical protein n=1 Tax=Streptomyces sp. NPDC005318 TaxID=3157031 RepID=UPI0033A5D09E